MSFLRQLINRLLYPHTYCNDAFVKYLRRKGAVIGEKTRFISPKNCLVDEARCDYIKIGKNCCLSFASLIAHDYSWYVLKDAYNDILPDSGDDIIIGDNCFIGYRATILKGTTIGDNCIIWGGAIVKGNIPSNTVWAGVPARQICTLNEFYQKRKKNALKDAVVRRDHYQKRWGRFPTIQEMGFFAYLFLERTEENYDKYFRNLEFNGIINNPVIRDFFFSSTPKFISFEDFLAYKE